MYFFCLVSCNFVEKHVEKTENHLRENLFGQDYAIDLIIKGLKRHESMPIKPLAFHFAGDNVIIKIIEFRIQFAFLKYLKKLV